MKSVACNLCGANDYQVLFAKGYAQVHQIVRCNRCGLIYANPQEVVDCERFRNINLQRSSNAIQLNSRYLQKQYIQLPDYERILSILDKLCSKRGRFLEIGSFIGVFLNCVRADGWNVTGLEPDRIAAEYSRLRYNLPAIESLLSESNLPANSFDAIAMLHVIEHMPDPATSLREVHRSLCSGGILVVETPRFDSLMFKLLGRRERSLANCDGHIYFFTTPTLRLLLQKCGFRIIRTDLVGRTLTVDRFLYNVGIVLRNQFLKNWFARIGRILHLDSLRFYINIRDMQRIYCRAEK